MTDEVQLRGDTAANWAVSNRVLKAMEVGFVRNLSGEIIAWKVGDGVTPWIGLALFSLTAGGGGGASSFTHSQPAPLASWVINHNLGRDPSVSVLTLGGSQIWPEIIHVSENQTQIAFSAPTAGSAYFI